MAENKPIHTIVLDTGAIIKNEPPVSTLLGTSESLVTTPDIIAEIKDTTNRSRVETTLRPFLTLRSPNPTSVKFVTDFARRTGDLAVLSKADIHIIALTYEIECERNGGDWRLRRSPGQKRVNGAPPAKPDLSTSDLDGTESEKAAEQTNSTTDQTPQSSRSLEQVEQASSPNTTPDSLIGDQTNLAEAVAITPNQEELHSEASSQLVDPLTQDVSHITLNDKSDQNSSESANIVKPSQPTTEGQFESDSDSDDWITPSNLKKKQAEDAGASTTQTPEPATMQVAVLTTDFAMQNVALQINLNLLSPSLSRVRQLKTFVLRCHACFQTTKDMKKQFCPKCGQPSLTRVSCSTNSNGEFKLHLKKNMQWNSRGDRYSIPKPVHGSSNGRMKGGGKGGWGNTLLLAEDQKEYQRAVAHENRQKERSLMDDDYLPSILTGDRNRTGGRIQVGAGRNVNSRKR